MSALPSRDVVEHEIGESLLFALRETGKSSQSQAALVAFEQMQDDEWNALLKQVLGRLLDRAEEAGISLADLEASAPEQPEDDLNDQQTKRLDQLAASFDQQLEKLDKIALMVQRLVQRVG